MTNKLEKIKRKIRKRIQTIQLIEGRVIEEVQITREEAEQLGDRIKEIDGAELIIVDKLGGENEKRLFCLYRKWKRKKKMLLFKQVRMYQ